MVPEVSFVLVNWNTRDLADQAIASIFRFERTVPFEIILVDNASSDGSAARLAAKYPGITVIANDKNEGFAKANNRGAREAKGEYLILLNSDAYLIEEILPACTGRMRSEADCILACRVLNPDLSLQFSADDFPSLAGYLREAFGSRDGILGAKIARQAAVGSGTARFGWATGAFLMARRATYLRLGGLREDIFMYGEDTEFCHRAAEAGVPTVYFGGSAVVHIGGGSAGYDTLRSLALTDAGRLRTFALMRGPLPALALRLVFILRSTLRAAAYLPLSLPASRRALRRKAFNHFQGALLLLGVKNVRDLL
jgi:GT2 family glycosyltransferase